MSGFRVTARQPGLAALLLVATLMLVAPIAGAALPGPAAPGDANPETRESCSFARCAPRPPATWGHLAGFGGAIAVCGWIGRRRR